MGGSNYRSFDAFFFIDDSPFVLLFGTKGETFSFEMKVPAGFETIPQLDNATYKELHWVLELKLDTDNPFKPERLF